MIGIPNSSNVNGSLNDLYSNQPTGENELVVMVERN